MRRSCWERWSKSKKERIVKHTTTLFPQAGGGGLLSRLWDRRHRRPPGFSRKSLG